MTDMPSVVGHKFQQGNITDGVARKKLEPELFLQRTKSEKCLILEDVTKVT